MRRNLTRQQTARALSRLSSASKVSNASNRWEQTIAAKAWDSSIVTVKSVQTDPRSLETNDGSGAYTSELLLPFLWPSDLCGVCLRRTVFNEPFTEMRPRAEALRCHI